MNKEELKKTRIKVSSETLKMLSEIFDIAPQNIYRALRFESNHEKAEKIRKVAINQYDGKYLYE